MRPVLSVLDLAPVTSATTAGDALRHSSELVQHVERLGYVRHWVAEHHNIPERRQRRAGSADGAPRRRHEHDPHRLRRRDAAEPRPAGGRRAVRDPGRPASRPHRPRHRPRPGHRRGDGGGAAAPAGRPLRRPLPRGPARRPRLPRRRLPADPPVLPHPGAAGRDGRAGPRGVAARVERLQRAARRRPRAALRVRPPLRGAEHAAGAGAVPPVVHAGRAAGAVLA